MSATDSAEPIEPVEPQRRQLQQRKLRVGEGRVGQVETLGTVTVRQLPPFTSN